MRKLTSIGLIAVFSVAITSPLQASAYYYGYGKMQSLRAQTELKLLGDFVPSQMN